MASNLFSKITTFLNRIVDTISQGSLERVRILQEFNYVFKEVYMQGDFNRLCTVTTSSGNPNFKHQLSTFYLRSGLKVTIENHNNLTNSDIIEISKYFIESKPFVRQLMALGYDTLIIKGKNNFSGVEIALKQIADLQEYMLNG